MDVENTGGTNSSNETNTQTFSFLFFEKSKYDTLKMFSTTSRTSNEICFKEYSSYNERIKVVVNLDHNIVIIKKESNIRNYLINNVICSYYDTKFIKHFDKKTDTQPQNYIKVEMFFSPKPTDFHNIKIHIYEKPGQRKHYRVICDNSSTFKFIEKLTR